MRRILLALSMIIAANVCATAQSWTADNGNGTYTNPLFYDEFSDPDIIRVGSDFYLAGTTMHAVPGVVVLHSRDLVNWEFLSYAYPRIDVGDEFSLTGGKEAYGQGIWAPCIRYHNGTYYIFSNVNGHGLQVFKAKNPRGPWEHTNMGGNIYDLSVLFDDNGKIYAVYHYDEVKLIEIKPDFSGYVEGSERTIIPAGNAMGEGHHFYKINGKYYIISANYSPKGRMQCARADKVEGPYETCVISASETLGYHGGLMVTGIGKVPDDGYKFNIIHPAPNDVGATTLHQGGLVDLPNGQWWGFSMMDFHSVGRTTCLSPITWQNDWPYFGLPGNLGRTPRTWVKPAITGDVKPCAPYERSDNFDSGRRSPVWQWNHNPTMGKWSYTEKRGVLRLHTLPAKNLLWARNSLTQRAIGPSSIVTVKVDGRNLTDGDIAGLGLLNIPYAWIGITRDGESFTISLHSQYGNTFTEPVTIRKGTVWLCAHLYLDDDIAQLSYSTDGNNYTNLGDSILLPYQLKTFQGTRIALFAYNEKDKEGGFADFDDFTVIEPQADRSHNLPIGQVIRLTNLSDGESFYSAAHGMLRNKKSDSIEDKECLFRVIDRSNGRIALESLTGRGYVTVVGAGLSSDVRTVKELTDGAIFQWQDLLNNHCMLLSLHTNRFVGINSSTGEPYSADYPGTTPDCKNGTVFSWQVVK